MAAKSGKQHSSGGVSIEERAKQAIEYVKALRAKDLDWVTISNSLYGPGGKLSQLFTTPAERNAFVATKESKLIDELVGDAKDSDAEANEDAPAANGRILVRVPQSIHRALLAEAKAEGISLNQLCLAKLALQLRAAVRTTP